MFANLLTKWILAGLAIWLVPVGLSASDMIQKDYVVLELYTSQGCSTCPPADRLLYNLANAPPGSIKFLNRNKTELIPLGLHVDYWDYLGWKDDFAQTGFSERQREYANSKNWPVIYTPQMIVQGTQALVGSDWNSIRSMITKLESAGELSPGFSIAAGVGEQDPVIDPSVVDSLGFANMLDVLYVRYEQQPKSVAILGGENKHRTIDYANIVTELKFLGSWDQRLPFQLDLGNIAATASGSERELILLQEENFGRFVGVGILD